MRESVIWYRGAGYRLGRGPLGYAIWPAGGRPDQPLEQWPETPAGWSAAWSRFNAVEAPGTIVHLGPPADPAAGPPAAPGSWRPAAGPSWRAAGSTWPAGSRWSGLRSAGPLSAAILLATGVVCGLASLFPGYLSGGKPRPGASRTGAARDLPGGVGGQRGAHRVRRDPAADGRPPRAGHEHRHVRLLLLRPRHGARRRRPPAGRWAGAGARGLAGLHGRLRAGVPPPVGRWAPQAGGPPAGTAGDAGRRGARRARGRDLVRPVVGQLHAAHRGRGGATPLPRETPSRTRARSSSATWR